MIYLLPLALLAYLWLTRDPDTRIKVRDRVTPIAGRVLINLQRIPLK